MEDQKAFIDCLNAISSSAFVAEDAFGNNDFVGVIGGRIVQDANPHRLSQGLVDG